MTDILLCCDLDRTLLPNGVQPESIEARPLFSKLTQRPEVTLVYVSGRDKVLLQEAIHNYELPIPDYAIGDVGTTIYKIHEGQWHLWQAWEQEIAPDWKGRPHDALVDLFIDIEVLRLQEPEKQNTFKLSYYAPPNTNHEVLLTEMDARLNRLGLHSCLIWSVDEAKQVGLLDVLPRRATKAHAIRFLMERKGFDESHTVFAGDSGNDLMVLTSGLQVVLVRNAREEVRQEALRLVQKKGYPQKLYLAQGDFMGMNGNYAAGVLEGVAHFVPEVQRWLDN